MRKAPSLALTLVLLLTTTAALAAPKVAALGIEAIDAPFPLATTLSKALAAQLKSSASFELVPGKEMGEIRLVFGCDGEQLSCMAKAGRTMGANQLVWGSLKKAGAAGYRVTVKWIDVDKASLMHRASRTFPKGPLDEMSAEELMQKLLRPVLGSNMGAIKLTANVSGARVRLGTQLVGTTDVDPVTFQDVPAGTHLVTLTLDGYKSWTRQVMVEGGQTTEVDAKLELEQSTEPFGGGTQPGTETSSGSGWKVAFWTGAAVAVGLTVAGGVSGGLLLGAEDDKQAAVRAFRDSYRDPDGVCRDAKCSTAFASDNVCSEANSYAGTGDIKDACDRGDKFETLQFAFYGSAAAVGAISAYLFYKAYLSSQTSEKPTDEQDSARRRRGSDISWSVSPTLGPDGAGVGFGLTF